MTTFISLASSNVPPVTGSTSFPADETQTITAVLLLKRALYNDLSLTDYANKMITGEIKSPMSYDDFSKLFSCSQSNLDLVVAWAQSVGLQILDSSCSAAMIKVSGSIGLFNSAFNVILQSITIKDKTYIGYSGTLSIPQDFDGIIEYVIGLNNPVCIKHLLKKADFPAFPTATNSAQYALTGLTPLQVAGAYNFPSSNGYGQCIGLIEYGGGYTTQNLTSSFSAIGLSDPTVVSVNVDTGTNNPSDPSGSSIEVMLDIFVAGAVAPNSKIAVYFGAGAGSPVPGPNWYDPINAAIHDTTNSPSVLSISWGESEASFGSSNMTAMDSVLAQAVILGITICAASGDSGSTWDGTGVEVLYPASSPYVLACGGTSLALNGAAIGSEVVWNESANNAGAGGGGISIYETRPSYQSGLSYTNYPSNTVHTLATRGVPDVAGNADPYSGYTYYCYYPGQGSNVQVSGVGGTSSVAPLWAGLIARINNLTGKRLGLLNSLLYSNTTACNDITSGENVYTPSGVTTGYSATVGWDACTGLGSPNGTAIFRLVNTGAIYPAISFGFRPTEGAVWPRFTTGVRPN